MKGSLLHLLHLGADQRSLCLPWPAPFRLVSDWPAGEPVAPFMGIAPLGDVSRRPQNGESVDVPPSGTTQRLTVIELRSCQLRHSLSLLNRNTPQKQDPRDPSPCEDEGFLLGMLGIAPLDSTVTLVAARADTMGFK